MEPLLTPKEVAEFLRVSPATVRDLAKRGEIPSVRLGALFRFSRPALMRYFDEAGQG